MYCCRGALAVAKPVAYWVTGWNITAMQAGLPTELITAVDNLLQLLNKLN